MTGLKGLFSTEGGEEQRRREGKTFSMVRRMCARVSVKRQETPSLKPNTPLTELVVINLAKCEYRAGKWACFECRWFPLLAELTYRLSGSFSLKSSPMTCSKLNSGFNLPGGAIRPPHPGRAVSAAAAPRPRCPSRIPTHCSSLANPFHSWGRGCPANSAHLCKLSLTGMREMLLWELPPRSACRAQGLCTSIHSWTRWSPFMLLSSHAYIAVNADSFRERLEISS